ncbi:MAG: hypothetical protein ABS46_06930 [Cytophagaceae bacterium SCN 52-12]|nr:MAG: hypothetical protein ABS46_06930 [Cytophagaceae bacterium SCN 52-12]
MNEDFLAFVWQHQYFDHSALNTLSGHKITVLRPGYRNTNAGPDFFEARIEIGGMLWIGNVELHVRTSGWNQHGHSSDKNYDSVILHVVWENDLPMEDHPNTRIPVMELRHRVDPGMTDRYLAILETMQDIPCGRQFPGVPPLVKSSMTDRVLVERLQNKSVVISDMLARNNGDWDETAWQLLARYFGAKVNADAFQSLAERIPLKILLRHRDDFLQLEALLLGTAGLIPSATASGYVSDLKREYTFLSKKYGLEKKRLDAIEWKMFRLRPAGFPAVRIAQLASLVSRNGNLFSLLTSFETTSQFVTSLRCIQSAYWHTHYHFGRPARTLVPPMGIEAVYTLVINAAAPLLAAYSFKTDNRSYLDRAVRLLEEIPAENNRITRKWKQLGLEMSSAASSQGATEWYHRYCILKRCLSCAVGNVLLKKKAP